MADDTNPKFAGQNITEKEAKLLSECKSINLRLQVIPSAIFGGMTVFALSRKGLIKELSRYGPYPKTFLGFGAGALIGKVGLISILVEKFVTEQPNSKISWMLRQWLSRGKPYIFSNQELLLSTQCKKDAFWYRGIPSILTSIGFTSYCFHKELICPHPKFGIWPKIISMAIVAYYISMITYRTTRMERFLKDLPDSVVSKHYRKGFGPKTTDEEIFMFSECLHDGILYKSIPLSLFLSSVVLLGMRNGRVKMSPRFGIWPKTLTAFGLGLGTGFFVNSYTCAQRFATELPDSKTAQDFNR